MIAGACPCEPGCGGAQVHARSRPMADDVDLMQVAQDLPGLSGEALAFSG